MNAQKKCQVLWIKAEYKCSRPTHRILLHTYRLTSICLCIPCLSLKLHQTFRSCPDNVLTASFVNHPPHQSSLPTVSQMLLSAPAWRMINDVSHGCHGCKHSDGSIQSASDEVSWWHTHVVKHIGPTLLHRAACQVVQRRGILRGLFRKDRRFRCI